MVAVGDLDQAQFGPEGVFAHEFGIDRDEIAVLDEVAEFGERGAGLDKRMNLHAAPIQRVGADGQEKLPPLRAAIEGGAAGAERPPRAAAAPRCRGSRRRARSEEQTSELQSLMRTSNAD